MSILREKARKTRIPGGGVLIAAVFGVFLCAAAMAQAAQVPAPVAAQAQPEGKRMFEVQGRAVSGSTVLSGKTPVHLWGIEDPGAVDPTIKLRARTALDNLIGGKKISCELKARSTTDLHAQCVNAQDQDLSLYMLQKGYVTVDRGVVYGTVFEDAYIQAETAAQDKGYGVWAQAGSSSSGSGSSDGTLMLSFGFILFLCIIGAFTFLSIIIMRGFQKVVDAQNDNIAMMTKERKLREQEREVVAVMLNSELKANKAKIEAYVAVYDEMLKSMKDPDRPPKYKKAGDIVQRQPALGRTVFDRNTDKIDVLGSRLSSELVHFYARIKSDPEYVNLEPHMELQEAVEVLERSLKHAGRLNDLAARLLDSFAASGIMSEKY